MNQRNDVVTRSVILKFIVRHTNIRLRSIEWKPSDPFCRKEGRKKKDRKNVKFVSHLTEEKYSYLKFRHSASKRNFKSETIKTGYVLEVPFRKSIPLNLRKFREINMKLSLKFDTSFLDQVRLSETDDRI